jgi:histidyl-tRNA synthetase
MLADVLEAVGIPRGDYIVRVNNRKVLNGVMEARASGPGRQGAEDAASCCAPSTSSTVLGRRACALLGKGRQGRERRLHRGRGAERRAGRDVIMGFTDARRDDGAATSPGCANSSAPRRSGRDGVAELEQIAELLDAQGYGPDRIVIDPSVVRGLGYYTGPVYEAELTFEILDEKGRPRQFGSVAGGGRYDDLVKRFTGQEVPATGVSIGVDRLLAALRAKGRLSGTTQGPVVVT